MYREIILMILIVVVLSCQNQVNKFHSLGDIRNEFKNGNLTLTKQWSDSLLVTGLPDSLTVIELKSLQDYASRINADFTLSEPAIEILLKKECGKYSQVERDMWEQNNWLEFRIIDGEKRYFKRAVSNLKLIIKSRLVSQPNEQYIDSQSIFCLKHSQKVIAATKGTGKPVLPVKMKVHYLLTVIPDVVPDGETIRCWLPWPHENNLRQKEVKLLKTNPESNFIAPDSCNQRSVYLEQKAAKGKPTIFELQFEYTSSAQYFDLNNVKIVPYDQNSAIYKNYTREQYPQIVFTPEIKHLSDSIVAGISDPVDKVKKIYYWINDHIIWTGALEYSIIPFIPGYVLKNRRGDCGMQTLLFIAMARYQHIPVKWQSGWMMHPNAVNLHDWSEVYYNGIGWVPLDMSFNLQKSPNNHEKEFYISGIDSYRLIVNDGIGSPFVPNKKFARSEPYDFQRGEVEWRGGNLYFNQWDYHLDVTYN